MAPLVVLAPVKLDCLVLTPLQCDGPSKIAPITQPNYTYLRLYNNLIQQDILDPVDLHLTSPAALNPRLTDLGNGQPLSKRYGVYVHWSLPRVYRAATASTTSASDNGKFDQQEDNLKRGFPAPELNSGPKDAQQPQFRPVPNRWMIIRHLDLASVRPVEAKSRMSEFEAFVVESDRVRSINDPEMDSLDLEVEVSPFAKMPDDPNDEDAINAQAEMFIGRRTPASRWSEDPNAAAHSMKLTLLSSSNPLLADYQPHNSNVFSMIDNFSYTDGSTSKALEEATASYYVLGWHRNADDDPFTTSGGMQSPLWQSRLSDCLMELKDTSDTLKTFLSTTPTEGRILCHGAMYDVKYSIKNPPKKNKADDAVNFIRANQSVAIGGTALDGLLAFLREHDSRKDAQDLSTIESDILSIQSFLLSQEEDYDSQVAAQDIMYSQNFTKSEGGSHWHFNFTSDGALDTEPTVPTEAQLQVLRQLNAAQRSLDIASRKAKRLRWGLFSEWWKYVSDRDQSTRKAICAANVRKIVADLKSLVDDNSGSIQGLSTEISRLQSQIPCKQGALKRYFKQRDPTMIVGGLESGWPVDFLDKLKVRFDSQVVTSVSPPTRSPNWTDISGFAMDLKAKLPGDLQNSTVQLLQEFSMLRSRESAAPASGAPEFTGTIPLYHDDLGRDDWQDTQPFFPVFMEWEAVYYHIPFEQWTLEERTRPKDGARIVKYGIPADVSAINPPVTRDVRTLSGRAMILPQPGYSLDRAIQNVFTGTPKKVLDEIISPAKRDNVSKNLGLLKFLSAPLSGLTSHLQTVVEGMHIKPLARRQGGQPVPVAQAVSAASDAGFTNNIITMIGAETTVTPYSALVNFNQAPYEPFKPATHGQMMFTKINIIDKFGQAVCAIDPGLKPREDPPGTIYPCMSENYAPGSLGDNLKPIDAVPKPMKNPVPNTVCRETIPGLCRFIQMPPTINQGARLNSCFVVRDPVSLAWRPVTEWENPIWGWLVVNYANYGLQLFLADGTFYREVRVGGASGATPGLKWLPFDPPKTNTASTTKPATQAEGILQNSMRQLDFLITKLTTPGGSYLQGFFNMINQSILSTKSTPETYGDYLPSIVGKPLALVNTGWSIELAEPPFTSQTTLPNPSAIPSRKLLFSDAGEGPVPGFYDFPIKLGDKDRAFDGLVGYFDVTNPGAPLDPKVSDLALDQIYTYFTDTDDFVTSTPSSDPDIRIPISSSNFPKLHPYYIDPISSLSPSQAPIQTHDSALQIHGVIMDPFIPIHAYSAILPISKLSLPPWTVQSAMRTMTAFFHMGPLILTRDIAGGIGFEKARELKSGITLAEQEALLKGATTGTVDIPVVGAAEWAWLQPFVVDVDKETGSVVLPPPVGGGGGGASGASGGSVLPGGGGGGGASGGSALPPSGPAGGGVTTPGESEAGTETETVPETEPKVKTERATRFNAFGIGPVDGRPRLEKGPYTALEGYLQLKKPIVGPSVG